MIVIPAIILGIIYLILKILVPSILIVALVVLLCIYWRNRNQGEGENNNINIDNVKEKATDAWEKIKFITNFFKKKEKTEEEEELKDV